MLQLGAAYFAMSKGNRDETYADTKNEYLLWLLPKTNTQEIKAKG